MPAYQPGGASLRISQCRILHTKNEKEFGTIRLSPGMLIVPEMRYDSGTAPRILLLVPWLAMGGADKFNLDLLTQLTRRGWQVCVATTLLSDHPWLPRFAQCTPDIFLLDKTHPIAEYPQFLHDIIQTQSIDLVLITNSELGYLLLPHLRAQCPDTTFVDYCHMEENAWKRGGYPRMSIEHQELLDLHIVSSHYLRDWMVAHGAEAERVRVCHTNIDPDLWRADPAQRARVRQELRQVLRQTHRHAFGHEHNWDDTLPIVLYAGRICDQKQPQVFVDTMQQLRRKTPHFLAVVAGDGPEFAWLQARIGRDGLQDKVCVLGAVSNERIQELMTAADIFFLPSQWEGIALSIFEAMACGVAVVGADVGGQRELVTPECGVLIARGNAGGSPTEAEHYAKILAELLSDPQRRTALAQAGAARIRHTFRLDQMGERMTQLCQEARHLHADSPRPIPDKEWGQARAARTITYLRLQSAARRLVSPATRALLDRKMKWLLPVKETVERVLLR